MKIEKLSEPKADSCHENCEGNCDSPENHKTEDWEKKCITLLQQLFVKGERCDLFEPDICDGCDKRKQVIDFIRQQIKLARQEERERIIEILRGMKYKDPHTIEWHEKYDWRPCESKSINDLISEAISKINEDKKQ